MRAATGVGKQSGTRELDGREPAGPIEGRWDRRLRDLELVAPALRRSRRIVVVGSGLAGASAAATLAEAGYSVSSFCYQDSARRAHSVAAQGGINAAKNYRNDGDSVWRLFSDTLAGGDFRSRESNVYRLAQLSERIIDHCVAQGVPFAREYGGMLDTRSFGGAQVSRTFYARGQTGQQLLLGAYQALQAQVAAGRVRMHTRHEMLDLVVAGGRARGIVTRDLVTGRIEARAADAVVLATGGYANVYHLSTNAVNCNVTAIWRAHKRGAMFANPCFTQIHPTCVPPSGDDQSKLTLMSESLRNDGRMWVPARAGDDRPPHQIPESERDYFLERRYPRYGNLVPRDIASRAVKEACDAGHGVGPAGLGAYLDFSEAVDRLGRQTVRERYGNLFDMYTRITGEDAYASPMRIYPAVHYTMGGLWVDYDLQTTLPGLFCIGEANFSDHGANRLGASALMQGLADGYFILPATLPDYLATADLEPFDASSDDAVRTVAQVDGRVRDLAGLDGTTSPAAVHRELGRVLWDACGMSRSAPGLSRAIEAVRHLRERFWADARVPGEPGTMNQALERAGRVADFLELAELMCVDALARRESCGAHFRVEFHAGGEPVRDDEHFAHVAAYEHRGKASPAVRHVERLRFSSLAPATRSYT